MNILSSKIKLTQTIKQQQNELSELQATYKECLQKNEELKEKISKLTIENKHYHEKYIDTNLECGFCYTVLQSDYTFCPKCGKKIKRAKSPITIQANPTLFQVEKDGDFSLITRYNGFNEKKIVIPSSINNRQVIGIWNNAFKKCTEIEEVIFEEGCQYIGSDAFHCCSNLKKSNFQKAY